MINPEEGIFGDYDNDKESSSFLKSCCCSVSRRSSTAQQDKDDDQAQLREEGQVNRLQNKNQKPGEENNSLKFEIRRCSDLQDEPKDYQRKYQELLEKYQKCLKELEEYKEEFRDRRVELSAHDGVEDMNNPFSNAKLANKFVEIKDEEWHIMFQATKSLCAEIDGIKEISAYMKEAYRLCNEYIASSWTKYRSDQGSTNYRKYREHFLEDDYRTSVTKEICDRCLRNASRSNIKDSLRRFLLQYVDVCLLLITSQPPIFLEFNVVGRLYSGELKQHFSTYCTQDIVTSSEDEENTIVVVVWPELNDHHGIHKKGLVVTVDEKIEDTFSQSPGPSSISTSTEEHTSEQDEASSSNQTEKENRTDCPLHCVV